MVWEEYLCKITNYSVSPMIGTELLRRKTNLQRTEVSLINNKLQWEYLHQNMYKQKIENNAELASMSYY